MSHSNKNKITKPKNTSNYKTSDRRLASGIRPELYLLSQQNNAKSSIASSSLLQQRQATPTQGQLPSSKQNSNNNKKYNNSIDEWNPKHFRLFVGNLGSDANDVILQQAFSKYQSLTKVHVPIDKNGENKGYGFVAFENPTDFLNAFRELNGKYIGHNPCVLKKANDLPQKKKKK